MLRRMQIAQERLEGTAPLEPLSFEGFFRRTYPSLAQALLLLTGERSEAEDLAQEAMARVYERWDRVRGMKSPEGYAYRTALNTYRKQVRWAAVRAKLSLPGLATAPDPAAVVGPQQEALHLLSTLPPTQREALVVVGWLGLDTEEAGRVLGIDAASVRGRIHRARSALRKDRSDE